MCVCLCYMNEGAGSGDVKGVCFIFFSISKVDWIGFDLNVGFPDFASKVDHVSG